MGARSSIFPRQCAQSCDADKPLQLLGKGVKQSRLMSLVEAVANVIVGYGVAVVTQILIFPIFGLHTTLAQNLKMGAIFTVVSIARSFALRRVFEAIRMRSAK